MKISIPFTHPIEADYTEARGTWGVILAHEPNTNDGILKALAKKLREKDIASIRFSITLPTGNRDNSKNFDNAFVEVWNYAQTNYSNLRWAIGGHSEGAVAAIRISTLVFTDEGSPPIISLGYPMYPPNKPEKVDTMALGALIGDALFCQGTEDNRGTYNRLRNVIGMMASHSKLGRIGGANHEFEVGGKPLTTVAYWISNDINSFLRELSF